MPAGLRQWRSKLNQIASQHGMLRGTLQVRHVSCGKPNCKCARGHKHRSVYLIFSKDGKNKQIYVSKQWEPTVRQWVDNYHDVRDLLEKISQHHCDRVINRQG